MDLDLEFEAFKLWSESTNKWTKDSQSLYFIVVCNKYYLYAYLWNHKNYVTFNPEQFIYVTHIIICHFDPDQYSSLLILCFIFCIYTLTLRHPRTPPGIEINKTRKIEIKASINILRCTCGFLKKLIQWSLVSSKSQTFGLGQTNRADKFWGIWVIFGRFISQHPFWYCESLVHVFH